MDLSSQELVSAPFLYRERRSTSISKQLKRVKGTREMSTLAPLVSEDKVFLSPSFTAPTDLQSTVVHVPSAKDQEESKVPDD